MIYLDSSVALAHLLAEDCRPPTELWRHDLVSSRLLLYEIWPRIHALNLSESHSQAVCSLTSRVALIELVPPILDRALRPFPKPVRTLDALHLASLDFLIRQSQPVSLATYDSRMVEAARALSLPLAEFL